MNKLTNLYKNRAISITQTTHGLKYQNSIDMNPDPLNDEVYAQAAGLVTRAQTYTGSQRSQSFVEIQYDGLPADLLSQYVHIYPSVKVGDRVDVDTLLGKAVESYTGHAKHCHLALFQYGNLNTPSPFSYLNRNTVVTSKYEVILNDRNWFLANGDFNWSSFPDLKLNNSDMDLKIGDRVEFVEEGGYTITTLRTGNGTCFDKVADIAVGSVAEIKDGPRGDHETCTDQKDRTWYDCQFLNNGGWAFDGRMIKTDKPVTTTETTIPEEPVEPPTTPPEDDFEKRVSDLEESMKVLSEDMDSIKSSMSSAGDDLIKAGENLKQGE